MIYACRLSFCDLAGAERSTKTQGKGDRMKEAGNINTSLLTLGRCIQVLRHNQTNLDHPKLVPFRDSKLTRLFQSFFCGQGKAAMIVNINQCASMFDETLHALKYSAVAKQVRKKIIAVYTNESRNPLAFGVKKSNFRCRSVYITVLIRAQYLTNLLKQYSKLCTVWQVIVVQEPPKTVIKKPRSAKLLSMEIAGYNKNRDTIGWATPSTIIADMEEESINIPIPMPKLDAEDADENDISPAREKVSSIT